MRLMLTVAMAALLWRSGTAMAAVRASCHLFVTAVLPGLLPYMTLSGMLASRCQGGLPGWTAVLLGWGGGSPAGARLLGHMRETDRRSRVGAATACATMSPMFLVGTCGMWLENASAGWVLLGSVLAGGALTGMLAQRCSRERPAAADPPETLSALSFGAAVEQAARTLLMVCGTMAVLRASAALLAELLPGRLALPVTVLLEVTAGVQEITMLPLPLAFRTALAAGATGLGGLAVAMQNRALYPPELMSLPVQLGWQAVHGALSFLIALGLMLLIG